MVLFLLLYAATIPMQPYVASALQVPKSGVADDPPFYFIREHFVRGVTLGITAIIMFGVAALTWKRYPGMSRLAVFFVLLWMMPQVVEALLILWRCDHLLDAQKATTDWPDFDSYLYDPYRYAALFGTMAFALAAAFVLERRRKKHGFDCSITPDSSRTIGVAHRPATGGDGE
jgi:hypothetical protein